jgi:RimJ/RimL family protein N-acetyltransferase
VRALVAWAFAKPAICRVTAQTFPSHVPSIRVLEKCGFRPVGAGSEPGAVRFALERPGDPARPAR